MSDAARAKLVNRLDEEIGATVPECRDAAKLPELLADVVVIPWAAEQTAALRALVGRIAERLEGEQMDAIDPNYSPHYRSGYNLGVQACAKAVRVLLADAGPVGEEWRALEQCYRTLKRNHGCATYNALTDACMGCPTSDALAAVEKARAARSRG